MFAVGFMTKNSVMPKTELHRAPNLKLFPKILYARSAESAKKISAKNSFTVT